jgi:hypothetical protein
VKAVIVQDYNLTFGAQRKGEIALIPAYIADLA